MARLITKFKYLKPGVGKSIGGYAKYIATREGVDKIDDTQRLAPTTVGQKKLIEKLLRDFPDSKEMLEYEDYINNPTVGNASEFVTRAIEDNAYDMTDSKTYADYIATRPRAERFGSHGLFTDDGVQVQLGKVSEELNLHGGNVWTAIISLRREDAERLGFNSGSRWRDMLRTQTEVLATNLKIPMENLRWYAAFHNESHHPHVHLIAYSAIENEGYLTKQGVNNLRSSFVKDIFAQDLLSVYTKQTEHRDALRLQSGEVIAEIISKINSGNYNNPALEEKLLHLADRLSKTNGKKVYGYLKADVKVIVNSIVDELSADERISALYDLWYEQREESLRIYTQEMPARVPLSENKEFKSIRNAVIGEAMNIIADRHPIENIPESDTPIPYPHNDEFLVDEPTEPDTEPPPRAHSNRSAKDKSWWTDEYKRARKLLYGTKDTLPDFEKALAFMQAEAETGNGFAMHDVGKMFLSGLGCEKDEDQAQEWYTKAYHAFIAEESVSEKPDYLQYRIGKLYSFGYGVEQDYSKAAEWYKKAVNAGNPFAAYSLGNLYRRGQGVAQSDAEAFSLFMMAATAEKKPNAYAAYELGQMYKDGIGTVADTTASATWYKKAYDGFLAIEQNMADDKLYYRLGQMNLKGLGVDVDLSRAKHYFEKAAALDNPDALYGLGKLYLNKDFAEYNPKMAVDYLIDAAKRDHEYAQYALGRLFLKGDEVPKNMDYALRWLEEAVGKGNQYAEYLLGKTLLKGEDVEQDLPRGSDLLKRSSDQGNHYAAYTLGKALLDGNLLLQNIPEAVKLLSISADKGFAPAQYVFGKLLYRGEVMPQDIEKSIDYLEKATVQKNPFAAYLAGKIRLTEDVVKDISKAIRNFEIAAENGNNYAEYQLGKLYLYGKEVDRDYDKAIAYLTVSAEHGNQYAVQLLHSIRSNRNWSAAMGSLRLLQHISRMLQNRLEDERKGKAGMVDRKLKRQIDEKKQAHGIRQ